MEKITTAGARQGVTLAFVWNRNPDKLRGSVPEELILYDLSDFKERFTARWDMCNTITHKIQICLNFHYLQSA